MLSRLTGREDMEPEPPGLEDTWRPVARATQAGEETEL
jgi:hypothetical protein